MNHQYFEELLLSEDALNKEEDHQLAEHLASCNQCRELSDALNGVDNIFGSVQVISPEPGFVMRWQAKLSIEEETAKLMRHRWQSLIGLILGANSAVILLLIISDLFAPQLTNPTSIFLNIIYKGVSALTLVRAVLGTVFSIMGTATAILPVWFWFVLGVGLLASMFLWLVTMKSLSLVPRRMKS